MTDNPLCAFIKSLHRSEKIQAKGWEIFPGVELFVIRYDSRNLNFHHKEHPEILQINYGLEGRVGWEMQNGVSAYFGAGDLTLHTMDCCAISSMSMPLGYYKGIVISVESKSFEEHPPALVQEAGIQIRSLTQKLCPDGRPFCLPANQKTEAIFSELLSFSEPLYLPYCKLKIQELFFYLESLDPAKEKTLNQYYSSQVEQIKEIHDFLVQNLDKRYTIEALSKQYLINTSSLKTIFKAVYGQPIAAYMKEYRIRRAMELLSTTDDSVAAIARSLSYENQGKFTKAFQDFVQMKPTEYRRHYKKG